MQCVQGIDLQRKGKELAAELDYYVKQARISYKISPNILDALEEEPQKVMLISLDQRDKLERFQKKNLNWEKGKCNSFFSSS